MSEKMDAIIPSPRREKPQTLDGIKATKSLSDSCGSAPLIKCGSDKRLARTRSRGSDSIRSIRDHSSDGVMTTTSTTTSCFKSAVEFDNNGGQRRESLNDDDTSPSGQSAITKSILGRSMRLSSVAGGTTTRKCVLTLDGYSYVIVASTPENLPKREDLSCNSNTANTGCPLQTGGINSSGGGGSGTSSNNQQQHSAIERGFSSANTNTQITGSVVGGLSGTASAGGVNSTHDFSKITSPASVDCTQEYNSSSSSSNISITNNSSVSTINGQVARHGALTIVRRSNSRKSFSQIESQHLHSQVSTPTSFTAHQGLLGDSLTKTLNDNRLCEATTNTFIIQNTSKPLPTTQTPTFSSQQHSTTKTTQILKMLPTSPNSGNFALPSTDDMEHQMDDTASTVASSSSTDLATDNLPAVDTPDACDKAALRLRSLLRMLNAGEIQADVLQKNLHYAARVLEAVFLDESKSPTSGKSKLRQNSCSSIECEEQGNKQEIKDERCNGDCRNVECNQHKHLSHSSLDPGANTNENNNINTSCSLLGNDETSEQQSEKKIQIENASNNQTSIDSRTKGVCLAPQTHSGPTGPPVDAEKDSEASATEIEKEPNKEDNSNTCTTKTNISSSSSENVNSSVSSSSCSNKATIQRQKRLRTPIWARTITTDKTYIKLI